MARFQCTEEEAIDRLQAFWNPQNEQDMPAPPEAPPLQVPNPQLDEDLPPVPQKKMTITDFEEDSSIPESLPFFPAQYAIDKIKTLDYVDLWYFTTEGILDASKIIPMAADDTFSLLQTDLGLTLQQVKATRASRNVVIDEFLSWDQIATTQHNIIEAAFNWPIKYRMVLAKFFMNLEAMKANGTSPRSLILYQAVVRKRWHTTLKGSGVPFNLANINKGLLPTLENQLRDRDQEEMQKQVCTHPSSPHPSTNQLTSPFSLPSYASPTSLLLPFPPLLRFSSAFPPPPPRNPSTAVPILVDTNHLAGSAVTKGLFGEPVWRKGQGQVTRPRPHKGQIVQVQISPT